MEEELKKQQVNDWYHSYSKDIYQYIFFLIGDNEQSKDLMQDTFFRAYKNFSSFHGDNLKGWLFKIARNLTIDYIRRKKPISYVLDALPFVRGSHASPEQILAFNETERELYSALDQIKRSYRDVIILRKIEEFSIQETCQILGWTESKVKVNLLRGIKALKKQMEKEVDSHEAM